MLKTNRKRTFESGGSSAERVMTTRQGYFDDPQRVGMRERLLDRLRSL